MVFFDSTGFGFVVVDGKKHGDLLVVGGRVVERELDVVKREFGTSHAVRESEVALLYKGKPEFILVGNGQDGVLEVDERFFEAAKRVGAQVTVLPTPKAILEFNLLSRNRRVNALIHVTC
ncbi:TPA: hypothetical protein HA318_03490 [Candidatus Micrarchaeota archaeon]|nr:hypothetical protein [Candidatus Micrarchaeota archaeon]